MEIWTTRCTSSYSGMDMNMIIVSLFSYPAISISYNLQAYSSDKTVFHRQHTLSTKVSVDAIRDLTCFWYFLHFGMYICISQFLYFEAIN